MNLTAARGRVAIPGRIRACRVAGVIVLGFAVAGCGGGSGASPATTPGRTGTASGATAAPSGDSAPTQPPPPTTGPSPTSESSPDPTPPPTERPSPCDGPRPIATPRPTDDPRITGLLGIPGAPGTPGVLGSFTLDGAGGDSPWLPFAAGRMVPIPPGIPITVTFGDGSAVGGWSALLADAIDPAALDLIGHGSGESGLPSLDAIQLEPLPSGCWVLAAHLFRADGRGSGITYWSVSVSP